MGHLQSMAYQVEVGPSSSPLHQEWATHPTIGNRFQKTLSCFGDQSWSHCQRPHKQTKLHKLSPTWRGLRSVPWRLSVGFPVMIIWGVYVTRKLPACYEIVALVKRKWWGTPQREPTWARGSSQTQDQQLVKMSFYGRPNSRNQFCSK